MVSADRLRLANASPVRPEGRWVLYWCLADRRTRWNPALERAAAEAERLAKPLLVVETMAVGYAWATLRFHRFAVQGMAAQAATFAALPRSCPVTYLPFVEAAPGQAAALVDILAAEAALVVCDEFPCFLLPGFVTALANQVAVRVEVVDGCGLMPLAAGMACDRAFDFRRFLQRELRPHLGHFPAEDPMKGRRLPALVGTLPARPGEAADYDPARLLASGLQERALRGLLDGRVGPAWATGGEAAARSALDQFMRHKLPRYAEERSVVEADVASGLSPWLHAGHLSVFEVVANVWAQEAWSPDRLGSSVKGAKEGWWGLSVPAEAFLDELVTWRELGYQFCHHRPGFDRWDSLPFWARSTLESHAADPREHLYTQAQFAAGETHDPLWNAAQRHLVAEGRMPNYLRMLWGKKVIEWTRHPEEALAILLELNNRYALDGCNPNSYSGIFWCFGRFDRPWAPQRPIFGSIRWMSSANTMKKQPLKAYVQRWCPEKAAQATIFA
jgi:deoxyribodipyrimidine photo-lyase